MSAFAATGKNSSVDGTFLILVHRNRIENGMQSALASVRHF